MTIALLPTPSTSIGAVTAATWASRPRTGVAEGARMTLQGHQLWGYVWNRSARDWVPEPLADRQFVERGRIDGTEADASELGAHGYTPSGTATFAYNQGGRLSRQWEGGQTSTLDLASKGFAGIDTTVYFRGIFQIYGTIPATWRIEWRNDAGDYEVAAWVSQNRGLVRVSALTLGALYGDELFETSLSTETFIEILKTPRSVSLLADGQVISDSDLPTKSVASDYFRLLTESPGPSPGSTGGDYISDHVVWEVR